MEASLFALLTALCIGAGDFSSHFALRHVKALPGAFFSLSIQTVVIFTALMVLGRWELTSWRGPAVFLMSGILHPGIFFFFLLTAVERVGPARAITLKGTSPFFGVAIAVLLLAERPNFSIWAGLFLVAGGVMYLTSERREGPVRKGGIIFPVGAAFFSGIFPIIAKFGLMYMNDPIMGSFFAVSGGLITLFIGNCVFARQAGGTFWLRAAPLKGMLLFIPMGVLGGLGWIFYYTALTYGAVSEVMPLVHAAPFVSILLSRILIQREEGVNPRLVVSAVGIALGAILITMGRA